MNTPQPHKLIFKGRLEFGSQRTFEMVLRHWQNRLETYYKTDVLFKPEQVFVVEEFALVVPQQTLLSSEKHWRSTTSLLREVAQFAVAGNILAWCVQNGQVLDTVNVEPVSDKAAVTEYQLGCQLVGETGMEGEASAALSRAIDKYARHAAAYERRGYVNYKLKNFNDALYDFNKSIDINPNNPEAFYGRAKVKMLKNDWEGAASDFDLSIKRSVALQPVHWLSRLKKGECLFHAKKYAEAAAELKLYLMRNFTPSDPNYTRRHRASILLGKALVATRDINGAMNAFRQAKACSDCAELAPGEANLLTRVETPDFARDLEAAVQKSPSEAVSMLFGN
jgi:tetratricopeptide (TPR) repeat protein